MFKFLANKHLTIEQKSSHNSPAAVAVVLVWLGHSVPISVAVDSMRSMTVALSVDRLSTWATWGALVRSICVACLICEANVTTKVVAGRDGIRAVAGRTAIGAVAIDLKASLTDLVVRSKASVSKVVSSALVLFVGFAAR